MSTAAEIVLKAQAAGVSAKKFQEQFSSKIFRMQAGDPVKLLVHVNHSKSWARIKTDPPMQMLKAFNRAYDWKSNIGLDVVTSNRSYEEYGNIKVKNLTFAFAYPCTTEVWEDFSSKILRCIQIIEMLFALEEIKSHTKIYVGNVNGGHDDTYLKSKVAKLIKPEGGVMTKDFDPLRMEKLVPYQPLVESVKREMDDAYHNTGLKLIYQQRVPWEVETDNFCPHCSQKTNDPQDFQVRFRARFNIALVSPEFCLTTRNILFRRFD